MKNVKVFFLVHCILSISSYFTWLLWIGRMLTALIRLARVHCQSVQVILTVLKYTLWKTTENMWETFNLNVFREPRANWIRAISIFLLFSRNMFNNILNIYLICFHFETYFISKAKVAIIGVWYKNTRSWNNSLKLRVLLRPKQHSEFSDP